MTRIAPLLIIVLILATCCVPSLAAMQYVHTRITTLNARVSDGQVNSSGTVIFTAQDNVTLHTAVYLNNRNYSAPILGPQSNAFAPAESTMQGRLPGTELRQVGSATCTKTRPS